MPRRSRADMEGMATFTRRSVVAATVAALVVSAAGATSSGAVVSATKYRNCAALNKHYPHGVARPGAKGKASGTPVTNFKVSKGAYEANRGKDRDHDGVACEHT